MWKRPQNKPHLEEILRRNDKREANRNIRNIKEPGKTNNICIFLEHQNPKDVRYKLNQELLASKHCKLAEKDEVRKDINIYTTDEVREKTVDQQRK